MTDLRFGNHAFETGAAAREERFDGVKALADRNGDVRNRQSVEVAQHERGSLVDGQPRPAE